MNAILVPDWLRGWVPPELARELGAMIASAGSMVQFVLEAVPALSGAVTVLAWAIWGLGAVILVALAVLAHVLIAFFMRRRNSPGTPGVAIAR